MNHLNVFLTGATGNVGQPTVKELVRRGIQVTCLSRKRTKIDGCKVIKGDFKKIGRLKQYIESADSIIHLASPRTIERERVLKEDILGTSQLIEHWRNGNFVYISSQTVYGIQTGCTRETNPLNPSNWYDLGKVFNEYQLIASDKKKFNRNSEVRLRVPLLFGYGERSIDRQFLYYVYLQCKKNSSFIFDSEEGVETYGSSYMSEEDIGKVIVDSLFVTESGAYNIASGFCSWKNLIEMFNKHARTKAKILVRNSSELYDGECRLPQSISFLDLTKFNQKYKINDNQSAEDIIREFIKKIEK